MGCHPEPIDELHHFSRWLLHHQPGCHLWSFPMAFSNQRFVFRTGEGRAWPCWPGPSLRCLAWRSRCGDWRKIWHMGKYMKIWPNGSNLKVTPNLQVSFSFILHFLVSTWLFHHRGLLWVARSWGYHACWDSFAMFSRLFLDFTVIWVHGRRETSSSEPMTSESSVATRRWLAQNGDAAEDVLFFVSPFDPIWYVMSIIYIYIYIISATSSWDRLKCFSRQEIDGFNTNIGTFKGMV